MKDTYTISRGNPILVTFDTKGEPLDLEDLASVSLFVSGRQAGEFLLRMQDWRLIR
ncbi:hypothetical protein SAMN04487868_11786 [Marinobacter salarius]|jgi:hypothetical protein|uniref:Uncharacterized protein n=1 Tax=Marinobacter salarius TaxID=1420917 RepID=A0ABY1FS05_9GAMM|nr:MULTISPECIES: hypothetical protein [Marinobacter]SFL96115.1 hypothetical protein SAMN04487868_11786 [Marinobacter salarius]